MNPDKSYLLYSAAFRYFVAVAEAGSIRGAARKLNVVSSAVNRQILNLEQSFNVKFFDRVGRGLRLSVAGKVLLKHAKKALIDFDAAIEELDDLSGLKRGNINIAVVESIADSILPKMVASFQHKYPGIEIDVQVMSSTKVTQRIAAAESHIALTFNPPDQEGLYYVRTFDMSIGAVVAPHHPIARKKKCRFEDCLDYPLAIPDPQLSIGKTIKDLLQQGEYLANTITRTNSLRFMRNLLHNSDYVAFQTRLGLEGERSAGDLVFIPIAEPDLQDETLVLLTNSSHELSLAPKEFLDHIEAALVDYHPK